MRKTADVIVTDGFTGNVTLKALEGGLRVILGALLEAFAAEEHYKPHADALLPALYPLYTQLSPDTYGGAMLLGVDGVCIISHGSSNSEAMLNAIKLAHEMVEHRLVDEIRAAVALHECPRRWAPALLDLINTGVFHQCQPKLTSPTARSTDREFSRSCAPT